MTKLYAVIGYPNPNIKQSGLHDWTEVLGCFKSRKKAQEECDKANEDQYESFRSLQEERVEEGQRPYPSFGEYFYNSDPDKVWDSDPRSDAPTFEFGVYPAPTAFEVVPLHSAEVEKAIKGLVVT